MGHVYVTARVGDPLRTRVREVRTLVDTGATYPCLPEDLARELGLRPEFKTSAVLTDGRAVDAWYTTIYLEVLGRGDLVPARVFSVEEPLLGAFALEALGLAVDPSTGEVKPTRSFIARA
ncbi:aspartyl protease family protein [Infirmifilum lucidum]|uniref:Aspartyl protease family protein n=1 Tax=Infirmifilum lucidum TaxID=2776706 RepID=A0A7L9FGZ2_9CREN|nr:aspartyl protease family protein [Infirmifilum lucidum]QOJ78987.1 aspartyl protease family protein [Infirmifilum lucidum]